MSFPPKIWLQTLNCTLTLQNIPCMGERGALGALAPKYLEPNRILDNSRSPLNYSPEIRPTPQNFDLRYANDNLYVIQYVYK